MVLWDHTMTFQALATSICGFLAFLYPTISSDLNGLYQVGLLFGSMFVMLYMRFELAMYHIVYYDLFYDPALIATSYLLGYVFRWINTTSQICHVTGIIVCALFHGFFLFWVHFLNYHNTLIPEVPDKRSEAYEKKIADPSRYWPNQYWDERKLANHAKIMRSKGRKVDEEWVLTGTVEAGLKIFLKDELETKGYKVTRIGGAYGGKYIVEEPSVEMNASTSVNSADATSLTALNPTIASDTPGKSFDDNPGTVAGSTVGNLLSVPTRDIPGRKDSGVFIHTSDEEGYISKSSYSGMCRH